MAKFNIKGIGYIEVPDGATREEAYAILQNAMGRKQEPQQTSALGQIKEFAKGIPAGIISGVAAVPEGLGAVIGDDDLKRVGEDIRMSSLAEYFDPNPGYETSIPRQAGEVVGNLATMLAPSAGATALRAPAMVTRGLGALMSMSQGAAEQKREVDRNRAAGMEITPEQEQSSSQLGSLTGLVDQIPMGRFTRFFKPAEELAGLAAARTLARKTAGEVAKDIAVTGLQEGATEGGQQFLQNFIEQQSYNPQQALTEDVISSSIAGAGAGAGLDALIGTIARRVGRKADLKASEIRARQTAPEVLPGDEEAIGIRSQIDGTPEVKYVQQRRPTRNEILDELSLGLYGKPLSELDAQRGMHLDRSYEDLRKMGMSDEQVVEHLTQPIDITAQPEAPAPAPPPRLDLTALPAVTLTPDGTLDAPAQPEVSLLDRILSGQGEDPAFIKPQGQPVIESMLRKKAKVEAETIPPLPDTLPDATLTPEGTVVTPSPLAMDQPDAPKFSVATEPTQPATPKLTVTSLRKQVEAGEKPAIALDMFSEMRRLGIDDIVSTRLVDTLSQPNANGSYANQIISLAMASQDPAVMRDTLNHEAVHAMKAMGLFNDAEWNILQGALNPNSVLSDDERRQYSEIYGDRPDIIQEEAVARGLERYASGKLDLEGEARTVAGQKIGMLDRLGNLFKSKNMQSPADVAAAFKEGRIGRREGTYAVNNAVANDQAGVDTERRISAEAGTTQDIPAVDAAKATEAVDPNSLSSMVTLDEEPENTPDVRLSLPQKPVNTFGKEVFAPPDERGGLRRALDEQSAVRGNSVIVTKSDRAFLPGARLATRIETIDKRAGVEEASRFLKHRPIESAIAAVRNADQSRTLSANSLESGPLEIKGDGPFHGAIGVKEGSTRGAAAVINDAREKGQYDRLKYYIAAERAKRLRPQGKEKLITPQQEAEWLKYGKDPEVKKFADELKAYNDQMVDFLLQSEVIDKATADKFKQGYFMAFYREDPNTKAVASQKSSSLTTQPQFVELQGSDQLIADPIENLVKNTNMITEMAMNNVAKQRIIRDGLKLGFAKQLKKSETSPTAVHVNIKGKKVSFEITDPVMYRSISAVNEPLDFWMKVAKMPSDLLRTAVTKTPIFMPRNMLRDSQHIHSLGYTRAPFMNVFTDTQKAFSDTGTMKKLEDMGVLSGSIQGEGAIGTAQVIRNKVRHGDNPLTRAWKTYSDFIDRGEAVNRITVYDHVYNREFESEMKANGGDAKKAKQVAEAAAQYETREVLNFGRHGANKWVRFVNAMIPFQNARLQGIDVLYRALKEGRGLNPEQKKQAVTRLVAQSIISMLYTAAVAGTAAYQAATKEERRDNYIIPLGEGKDPLKIPIAYEFGFLSKIIPEIAMQEILKAQDGKDIMKAFSDFMVEGGGATAEFLGKTSKIIDVPQNVKPIFEASINKDLFRERDIEPMWMQKLNPKYRYDDSTSELAKAVANYLPEGSEVSPAKIDHVLKGYFGTMGTYAMDLIDFITSPDPVGKLQDIKAIAEEGKYSKLPLFSPLFQRQDGAAALVDAMEIRNRAERDANTLKMAIRQGADISDAEREKLRKGAEIAKQTSAYDQRMSQLNRMMQQTQALMRNGQLTPSEGRKTLEEIRRRKIELSQPIVERYKDAVK